MAVLLPALVPAVEEPAEVAGVVPEVAAVGEEPWLVADAPPVAVAPKEIEVVFPTHEVEVPAWTVKAADCTTKPVPSRRLRPRAVFGATSTTQVNSVAFVAGKF